MQKSLQHNSEVKVQEIEFESSIYRKIIPVCLIGLFSFYAAIYHFDLNTFSLVRMAIDIPHLKFHRSDLTYLDKRFNCLKCTYSLKLEDKVAFIKEDGRIFVGRIMGMPGQLIQINNKGTDGRYLASTQEVKILEGKVAIRLNPDGSALTLVNVDQIRGRITTKFSHVLYPTSDE